MDVVDIVTDANSMGSNRCVDSWFDWSTGGEGTNHYDARVTRVCKDNSSRDSEGANWYYEPNGTASLVGVQKLALCFFNTNTRQLIFTSSDTCRQKVGSVTTVDPDFTANNPNNVTRAWIRQADGDPVISDNGYPDESNR